MFERFTDRARSVIVLAQQEAHAVYRDLIDTEHLLLGLLREDGNVASRVLQSMGIDPGAVRAQLAARAAQGRGVPIERCAARSASGTTTSPRTTSCSGSCTSQRALVPALWWPSEPTSTR